MVAGKLKWRSKDHVVHHQLETCRGCKQRTQRTTANLLLFLSTAPYRPKPYPALQMRSKQTPTRQFQNRNGTLLFYHRTLKSLALQSSFILGTMPSDPHENVAGTCHGRVYVQLDMMRHSPIANNICGRLTRVCLPSQRQNIIFTRGMAVITIQHNMRYGTLQWRSIYMTEPRANAPQPECITTVTRSNNFVTSDNFVIDLENLYFANCSVLSGYYIQPDEFG